jgi:hypothetical protein
MKGSSNGQFAYAASKAAFIQLTRMLATTLVEAKIRVNSIAPGVFPSEMTAGKSDENQKSEMNSEASNPSGRYGSEEDMGNCVLFLAGPASTWLNGQIVYPDGGEFLLPKPPVFPSRGIVTDCLPRKHSDVSSLHIKHASHPNLRALATKLPYVTMHKNRILT